jgi:hypothetical protein
VEDAPVVPLAGSESEALDAFRQLVNTPVTTAQGLPLEADFGDYVHVPNRQSPDSQRIHRIAWIETTVTQPDEMYRLTLERKGRLPA